MTSVKFCISILVVLDQQDAKAKLSTNCVKMYSSAWMDCIHGLENRLFIDHGRYTVVRYCSFKIKREAKITICYRNSGKNSSLLARKIK